MAEDFTGHLKLLIGGPVRVSDNESFPEAGTASVIISFANGTRLRADYWRLIKGGKHVLSSFDHQQRYGLPAPIDAKRELHEELENQIVSDAGLDGETGDLLFEFEGRLALQVLNFTGYEVWEIAFFGGYTDYSNCHRYR